MALFRRESNRYLLSISALKLGELAGILHPCLIGRDLIAVQ